MALTKVTGRGLGVQGDTVVGDDAALGFTSAEGLIITGQGSTNDVTIKNDADAQVCGVPTGTDDLRFPDNAQLQLGTGGDFKIYHDGSDNIILGNGSHPMKFFTNDAEGMRIDSSGNVLLNATSNTGFKFLSTASGTQGCVDCVSSSTNGYYALRIDMHANNNYAQLFRQGGSVVGYILTQNGGTSYNTSSDYRLKENVTYDFDATTRLKQLRPARFNFKAHADNTVDGFLAHEVQSVVPEAISGTHNEVDDDGNAVMQGIDQSKLVPLLVKTIQELEARITVLENA